MAFVVLFVLGLTTGFIGSQLTIKGRRGVIADMLIGLAGALGGGWLFYVYGPPSAVGLNLGSYYAALAASLAVLLIYYALKRI